MAKPAFTFTPAVRHEMPLTLGIMAASGHGKTFTALSLATNLIGADLSPEELEAKIAVIDTEGGKSALYAKGSPYYFSMVTLPDYSHDTYIAAIEAAIAQGFKAIILDGYSDYWEWCLEEIDRLQRTKQARDKRDAWATITPLHNAFIKRIRGCPVHLLVTVRMKPHYEMVDDPNRAGKKVMQRAGVSPVAREGFEHHFDVVLAMEEEAFAMVTKTRCSTLFGQKIARPGAELAMLLKDWVETGDKDPRSEQDAFDVWVPMGILSREDYTKARTELIDWAARHHFLPAEIEAMQKRFFAACGNKRAQQVGGEDVKKVLEPIGAGAATAAAPAA